MRCGIGSRHLNLSLKDLSLFAAGPVAFLSLDQAATISALQAADVLAVDFTDAVLLQLTQQEGARYLATEDQNLANVCTRNGITPESPINTLVRGQIAAWEAANLASKGLPRVLRRCHEWLQQKNSQTAQEFWSESGAGTHLP